MPVFVLLGILFRLLIHPVPELILGQQGELVEVLSAVIIVRCSAGLLKARTIKRDFIGSFHQLMDPLVLEPEDPVAVFDTDGFLFDLSICLQRIDMLELVVSFIISHYKISLLLL
jgi:hypothetical protein